MVITKERKDTTNKQELFMEEKTKEKEEFLKIYQYQTQFSSTKKSLLKILFL